MTTKGPHESGSERATPTSGPRADHPLSIDGSRLVFVGGLHRSGTTPFARVLAGHPQISGLTDTGVTEDEGQHLQHVYPPATTYGGAGHFARDPRAHLTEESALAHPENARALLDAWSPYWDLNRQLLVEKSPPNLLMSRWIQAVFPGSAQIVVIRHPVTVALSSRKWNRLLSWHPKRFASVFGLVEHWLVAHRTLREDLPHLDRMHLLYYEDLLRQPAVELDRVQKFLNLREPFQPVQLSQSYSLPYQRQWQSYRSRLRPGGWQRRRVERRFAAAMADFGYRVADLETHDPTAKV